MRCKTLHTSIKYKTSFKWIKVWNELFFDLLTIRLILYLLQNNKELILTDGDNDTRLTDNNQTLVLQAIKSGQNVTYTCEATNVHHTFYSKYTYNIVGMITKFNNSSVHFLFLIHMYDVSRM